MTETRRRRPKAVLKNNEPTIDLSEFNAPETVPVEVIPAAEVTYKVYLESEDTSWTIQDVSILAHVRKIAWGEENGTKVQRLFMSFMNADQFMDFSQYLATDGKYLRNHFTPYYWVETHRGDKVISTELTLIET